MRNERSRTRVDDLAPCDEQHGLAGRSCRSPPRGRARRASRRRARSGRRAPAARAASRQALLVRPAAHERDGAVSRCALGRRGRRRPSRARASCTSTRHRPCSPRERSSATVPLATRRPSLTIATASHSRSTSSSWWLENRTGTPASRARSTRTSLMTSTPTGSRPLNGSSRTSAIGSWTSAVASCTRCWLPSESCSTRSLGAVRRRRPAPSSARAAARRRRPRRRRAAARSSASCSPTRIFGYRPRSSGM